MMFKNLTERHCKGSEATRNPLKQKIPPLPIAIGIVGMTRLSISFPRIIDIIDGLKCRPVPALRVYRSR